MRLSEAIRKGSKLRPQGFGSPNFDGTSCALVAALEAELGSFRRAEIAYTEAANVFPILRAPMPPCPVSADCKDNCYSLFEGMIFHLNDDHKWSREEIADWVETIETRPAAA